MLFANPELIVREPKDLDDIGGWMEELYETHGLLFLGIMSRILMTRNMTLPFQHICMAPDTCPARLSSGTTSPHTTEIEDAMPGCSNDNYPRTGT